MLPFFRRQIDFVAGAATLEQIPPLGLPEVAFVGRSNVGKSSMLNALVGQNSLARTSSNPGHTRQVNFFNLNQQLMLVDVPGYGYAKAPKHEIARWQGLLFSYLRGRSQLARAFMLIDARHGIKPPDTEMMKILDDAAVSYQLVLTKRDKTGAEELEITRERCAEALQKHPAAHPHVLATSSTTHEGIDQLQYAVLEAAQIVLGE
jgi:GTP-binding protein